MATPYHAQAVKSLNKSSSGRRRFVFKSFWQRIEEIDIDVYRSLHPLKAEPSEESSFFRDCLIEYRELNTSKDFISFYEEIFPLVQRFEQIVIQKNLIISSLLSRLTMEARLSHEPILRLLAALSRDLLEDFIPFLPRIADSLEQLLESGAEKDPEIIEQIFISWSFIMMYLQKYLVKDVGYILRISSKLRYYSRDYVREFMAESISFLLRKAPSHQLKTGIMKLMTEVVEEPSEMRVSGASALLSHVPRIRSSRLYSKAEALMPLFLDESAFGIGDTNVGDSNSGLRVLTLAFERLRAELDTSELKLIWRCLCNEITDCVVKENFRRLCHLLAVLIPVLENDYPDKISDYRPIVELVGLLLQSFVVPRVSSKAVDQECVVIDKVLQVMLCIIGGLSRSKDVSDLPSISSQWGPVFNLRNRSLLTFMENIVKDSNILHFFGLNIMSAFNNLISIFSEEVLLLMTDFCEKMEKNNFEFFGSGSMGKFSKIHGFFEKTLCEWTGIIGDAVKRILFPVPFQQVKLAVLWAVIRCYPYLADPQANPSLLMKLIDVIGELLVFESGLPEGTWHSLIGVSLRSYHKSVSIRNIAHDESTITKFLYLAKTYKLSPQILSAVADILDSITVCTTLPDTRCQLYLSESEGGRVSDALDIFAENLCHANKDIRLSTLRILCHYEPLHYDEHNGGLPVAHDMSENVPIKHGNEPHDKVLKLLKSIEETALSVSTSRQVTLLISQIQMSLGARRVAEQYITATLYGIVGIFHNRFSYLWNPTSECLSILISCYFRMVWDRYVKYLDHYQSRFLTFQGQCGGEDDNLDKDTGLLGRFMSDTLSYFDSTPCPTVMSLLIQSLQKVPSLAESHSQQIVPLFLKFLGYNEDDTTSAAPPNSLDRKGKEWTGVLKEWLIFLRLVRNPSAIYHSELLRNILQYRLLDQNDADLQMVVLDCLLNWREDYLVPYSVNLKNLIDAKHLREELARWSLSRVSLNPINVRHRAYVVPIVIRILIPKVRNLKMLASQKNASVNHRRALLAFLAQLDVGELRLFFRILMEPLLSVMRRSKEFGLRSCSSTVSAEDELDTSSILKHFTTGAIRDLSWKQKYGFLHVVEDILAVFDEFHLDPFLDLLMNCVVRILASCTSSLCSSSHGPPVEQNCSGLDLDVAGCEVKCPSTERMSTKQFKDLRSLCLKIIYFVLTKYDTHDFGDEFWDLFFTSVKSLLVNFKQEGASSEKPSSLFNCFLAMSKSYKLVPLLQKENNLVPDIFSMLAVPSASESVISGVLKFAKNLLKLDAELGGEDDSVKKVLLPHIDVLIHSLHDTFTSRNGVSRRLVKLPGKMELTLFNLLAKYVKKPLMAEKFLDILLPLLTKRRQNNDTCVVLQIVREVVTVLGTTTSSNILNTVTPLLISSDTAVRCSICDVLDAVATKDSLLLPLANILRELNSTMEMDIDGVDYEKISLAYDKINVGFFHAVPEEHALLILAHCVHDMSSEDSMLRLSAFRIMDSYIDYSSEILSGSLNSNHTSKENIHKTVNKFLLKNMGDAMDKENAVRKGWLSLLRVMVLKIPNVANLGSYKALCCADAEQDFFNNISHMQKHRRARAVSHFKVVVHSGNLSEVVTHKVFIPLLFSMLFNVQDGKDEHIRSSCVDALAAISGCMKWNRYNALLSRCFRDLKQKPEKQKLLLRLICAILNNFHFSEVFVPEDNVSHAPDPYTTSENFSLTTRKHAVNAEIPVIQACLRDNLLPKIQKLMTSDSENINVNISLVALKLLKLLPNEIMELQLPSIIHRISNFLKHRLESVRDEARCALAACLEELGLEYLQFIVNVLKGTLKRGYELHVLGYTLNFILSKFLVKPICGKLDYCLEDILSIVVSDILGDVSEEKEVEKIASKMKETRKQKSYETLRLVAQSINFKSHALKLLAPVAVHLNRQLTQKVKLKLENILKHIAAGIESNPSVEQRELFIFLNCLIRDGINDEESENGDGCKLIGCHENVQTVPTSRLVNVDRRFSHLITAFALGILHNYLRKAKLNREDSQLLSLSDPFVVLLTQCLTSKYENIITASIRCLTILSRLPLPSLVSQADKIKNILFDIAQSSGNAGSQLAESCLKLLTTLLHSTKVTLSADQLHMLIQFPLFIDFAKNPSFVALSLLKAIIQRKLVVPEIYDLVQIVAELMVQSQLEPIRKKCSGILLQFLLGYHLSEKRLQQHLDFLLSNLRYEHSTGREAVLEMLHAIMLKFPQNVVDGQSQTLFVHFVVSLVNDDDSKVRSMIAAALKCLVGHVSTTSLHSNLEYCLSWYLGQKQNLWAAAAQVLGLLVEVMGKRFEKQLSKVLPVTKRILQSAVASHLSTEQNISEESVIPFWKEAYYSLVLFEKILHQFHNLFFDANMEDIWEAICKLLLHPHLWLRNISNRIWSSYFIAASDACREKSEMSIGTFFLIKPSRLFLAASSFCCQLKVLLTDDAAATAVITQNLVFSICELHSLFMKNESRDLSKFWSDLDSTEQERFIKGFSILDPRKGRKFLASFTSVDASGQQHSQHHHPFISFLLQMMGKISLQMEFTQMKIIFCCFKSIAPKLLCPGMFSPSGSDDLQSYAYLMLLPLYKVSQGYAGKVVTDDVKQLAQEVSETIRDIIEMKNYIQLNNQIQKNLKVKRDKRKREEKIMAVVNPMRNAKRKLRMASKHRAHKKRKIMTMKMGRWMN